MMDISSVRRVAAIAALGFGLATSSVEAAPVGACRFDRSQLSFAGDPLMQARCLLRHVGKFGVVQPAAADLPPTLVSLIGKKTLITRDALTRHLADNGFPDNAAGGSLNEGVSHAAAGNANSPAARYFVIHDTSSPWLGDAPVFPPDNAPQLNSLAGYGGPDAVAHVFVARTGATLVGHDFKVPWRATKLEVQAVGTPAKGLFLHVELLQPRRRDPRGGPKNDAIAPMPGFTPAQYEQLALLYAAASVRAGVWLIPAFHAAIDEGLSDAHDDPQNFELTSFGDALQRLLAKLGTQGGQTTGTQPLQPPPVQPSTPPVAQPAAPQAASDVCTDVAAGLASVKPGEPLIASGSGGKTWKALYDQCDARDTFAGRALPMHNGRRLSCSTDPNRVAFVSKYADGTIVFNAKMAVDADGSPVAAGNQWPNNVQTWLTYDVGSTDHFVNAEEVPFVVVPLAVPGGAVSFMRDTGVGKGDLALIVRGNRCSLGVVGDAGPWFRLGEASVKSHADLGNPQCVDPTQHPCRRLKGGGSGVGIASNVTYIVFPGSRPVPLLSQTINQVVSKAAAEKAAAFLQANKQ